MVPHADVCIAWCKKSAYNSTIELKILKQLILIWYMIFDEDIFLVF